MRVALLTLASAALTALAAASVGKANGDPASDYLLVQSVFLPYNSDLTSRPAEQLEKLVDEAKQAGFRIRVAVIASRTDLGTVPSLFPKPQRYAQFLGSEIFFIYRGRLLVVMPNGYGVAVGGKPAPELRRVLDRVPRPRGRDANSLEAGAILAVRRLAASAGHPLPLPSASGGNHTTRDRIKIAAIVVGALVLVGIVALVRRLRSSPPEST